MSTDRMRDGRDDTDEVLVEVQLSRVYFLVLARSWIGGRESALALKVRHEADDGRITFRGGFLIPLRKCDEVLDAFGRALAQLRGKP